VSYYFDVARLYTGTDPKMRDAFYRLNEVLERMPFLKFNGKLIEFTFDQAETNKKWPHTLNFIPRDVLVVYKTDGVTVTFNQDLFDNTELDITTSAACTVRALVGRF